MDSSLQHTKVRHVITYPCLNLFWSGLVNPQLGFRWVTKFHTKYACNYVLFSHFISVKVKIAAGHCTFTLYKTITSRFRMRADETVLWHCTKRYEKRIYFSVGCILIKYPVVYCKSYRITGLKRAVFNGCIFMRVLAYVMHVVRKKV